MPYTISTFFNQGPCKSHSLHCCQGMDFFDAWFPCKQCSGGCSCQRKSLNLHLPNQRGPFGRVCSLQQDICAQHKCAQVQLFPSALFCWQLGEGKKIIRKKIKASSFGHRSLTRHSDTNKKLLYFKGSREQPAHTERADSAVFQRIPAW